MENWNWTVVSGVSAVVVAIVTVLSFFSSHLSRHQARKSLKNRAAYIRKNMKSDLFPRSINSDDDLPIPHVPDFFYKNIQIIRKNDGRKCRVRRLRSSFVLFGESGCGKTAVMHTLFKKNQLVAKLFWSTGILYFEKALTATLFDNTQEINEIKSMVKDAAFSRLYVYIDGIDEQISNTQLSDLKDFISTLSLYTRKLIVRVSTREYLKNQLNSTLGKLITNYYEISPWKEAELKDYTTKLICHIEKTTKQQHDDLKRFFRDELNYQNMSFSPLICKLLLYNMLVDRTYRPNNNSFSIYWSFLEKIQHYSSVDNIGLTELKTKQFALEVYDHYYQGELLCSLDSESIYKPILKKTWNGKYTFIHQSFYEFFVAMHFIDSIKHASSETARIFTVDYSNSFADFISEALKLCNSDSIVNTISEIYSYTLNKNVRKEYHKHFSISIHPEIRAYIDSLGSERFITLKYMLVNRVGRVDNSSEIARVFLSFVYQKDNCVAKNGFTLTDDDRLYYRAILKRCCAISASFLGLYDVEIDYIRKMTGILDDKEYNIYYDLANRSHTLLYYGDVHVPPADELSFRDNSEYSCQKACRKRLNHLREINRHIAINQMNAKELRWYSFRLFDIATLYCFTLNRMHAPQKLKHIMGLSEDDFILLESFYSQFEGDNPSRRDLIEKLRHKTVELLSKET